MILKSPIYLDFNASTPPDPSAVDAMSEWLGTAHANPHAAHLAGQRAAAAIEKTILIIRKLINASTGEIIFTSGATEANNLALIGMFGSNDDKPRILHSPIEHKSVLEPIEQLRLRGATVEVLSVNSTGYVTVEDLAARLETPGLGQTIVSTMHANNEIGTLQPIAEISRLRARADFIFHVDAAQSFGKCPINVDELNIDLLSISSHKIYGPAGVGALYISPRARKLIKPILYGGGQQNGIRPGTLPVFLIAGFGGACTKALETMTHDSNRIGILARDFCSHLQRLGVSFRLLSQSSAALPGLLSLQFDDIEGDDLVLRVAPWLSISTGSACNSRELRSSHVLHALGCTDHEAKRVVRVGFGRTSTTEDATRGAEVIAAAIREISEA